ncbi:MAG: GNAT family N-acetyltransferase [Pseudomonadota bacterium]
MIRPDPSRLYQALDATWPAAARIEVGPWTLRQGLGGGQRVSAATVDGPVTEADIGLAEDGMRAFGQRPLFMIRGEDALDTWLDARGYDIVDPVTLYCAKPDKLAGPVPVTSAIPSWPPLAVQSDIWDAGGVTKARRDVMQRATGSKVSLLGRTGDVPCGAAFIAMDGEVVMLHALEVLADNRRAGVGHNLMVAAANWAKQRQANWLTLAVTTANEAANALYQSLGMAASGTYHYRRAPEITG